MRRRSALTAAFAVTATVLAAFTQPHSATIDGRWLSAGGDGVVEIFPCDGGARCGRLVWMKKPPDAGSRPPTDWHNPSKDLQNRPLCGLVMMGGFHQTAHNKWTDGWVYDPGSGKTYHANMVLQDDGLLRLRGYIGFPLFGENQIWTRAAPVLGPCSAD